MNTLQNKLLIDEIERWNKLSPVYKKAVEKMFTFIEMVDILSPVINFKIEELKKFIAGIAALPLYYHFQGRNPEKEIEYEFVFTKLISPAMDKLVKYLKSDEYQSYLISQQVPKETIINVDYGKETHDPISFLNYSKRNNRIILTYNDAEKLEKDFIHYRNSFFNVKDENKNKIIPFSDYLISNNKEDIIKKIKSLDRSKPKAIYIVLKALFDNGNLIMSENEKVYYAYYNEFGYHKSYETLKRGLNNYDFQKIDKKNEQRISNMFDYLTI